jgi:hypothetical protein
MDLHIQATLVNNTQKKLVLIVSTTSKSWDSSPIARMSTAKATMLKFETPIIELNRVQGKVIRIMKTKVTII